MEFNATFIIAMFSFVVFIMIMNAIYYKPVLRIINERNAFIDENYEQAKKTGEKTGTVLEEKEQRLFKGSKKAKGIVADILNKTTAETNVITTEANKKSRTKILNAKEKLATQEQEIAAALEVKDLVKSISAKILGGKS